MKFLTIFGIIYLLKNEEAFGASWSYAAGDNGPSNWKDLDPGYSKCGGMKQSPINIMSSKTEYKASLGQFTMTGFSTAGTHTLINNGHTIQVNVGTNATVTGGGLGGTFKVAQFHFHWGPNKNSGSEHTLNSKMYPLELHIVTYNMAHDNLSYAVDKDDGLAVLGFFLEETDLGNCHYDGLMDLLDSVMYKDNETDVSNTSLLQFYGTASKDRFYRYQGSLTTPPCFETVTWTVFADTIKLSQAQFAKFRTLFEDTNGTKPMTLNYRPVQNLNDRVVYTNFDMSVMSVGAASSVLYSLALFLSSLLLSTYYIH